VTRWAPKSVRGDMYYWIRRAIFPIWWERIADWRLRRRERKEADHD